MTTTCKQSCDCGNDEFYFVKDLNLDYAWKAGNKYSRLCTACGARYFLAKSIWEDISDQYVILKGEDGPVPIFDCPACEERVTGTPETCPYCDVEYQWDDAEEDVKEEPVDAPAKPESDVEQAEETAADPVDDAEAGAEEDAAEPDDQAADAEPVATSAEEGA